MADFEDLCLPGGLFHHSFQDDNLYPMVRPVIRVCLAPCRAMSARNGTTIAQNTATTWVGSASMFLPMVSATRDHGLKRKP